MAAICAAYPSEFAPQWCSHRGAPACLAGAAGATACAAAGNVAEHRTRCVETFSGFECRCAEGYREVVDTLGSTTCEDINECLMSDPCNLSQGRVACHNTAGSYRCATLMRPCLLRSGLFFFRSFAFVPAEGAGADALAASVMLIATCLFWDVMLILTCSLLGMPARVVHGLFRLVYQTLPGLYTSVPAHPMSVTWYTGCEHVGSS